MPANLKFSLEPIKALLDGWGSPHKKITSIAVAGTNGKGSTAAFIESILRAAGSRTGLYSSPHLFNFRERIKIDGRDISYSEIKRYIKLLREKESGLGITLSKFEIITAIAVKYFHDRGCEFCIMEAGLGGRLDATNAVEKKPVSIITPVSLEHTRYLGNSVEKIAAEKAAIIEPGSSVVDFSGTETVGKVARRKRCRLLKFGRDYHVKDIRSAAAGRYSFNYNYGDIEIEGLMPALRGKFQCYNAAAAVTAAAEAGFNKPADIKKGVSSAALRGRMELMNLPGGGKAVIDSAHNPAAVGELLNEVDAMLAPGGRIFLVMGVYKDKDYRKMAENLAARVEKAFIFTPSSIRALDAPVLAAAFGGRAVSCRNFNEAFKAAGKLCRKDDIVLITGSFSVSRRALSEGNVAEGNTMSGAGGMKKEI